MADIGSDHGFLPIYLYLEGISPKVIITDVSEGSLEKAKEDAKRLAPGMDFDFRRGDGLAVIDAGEVDDVVIAGMGGELISEILEWDLDKSRSIKKYILQPRSKVGYLRCWLSAYGFKIISEKLVSERGRICEILLVSPENAALNAEILDSYESDSRLTAIYDFPDMLTENPNQLTKDYLEFHFAKQRKIIEHIRLNGYINSSHEILPKARLARILELLKKIGE